MNALPGISGTTLPNGKGGGSIGDADIRDVMAELPKRATHRWTGYDYAQQGAYYLTICTQDRLHLFGRIVDGVLQPSPIGTLAQQCWDAIPQHMPHVDVGDFVVMPNHVHGIVVIRERLVRPAGAVVVPVGADHDRPGIATDHDRSDTIPDPDTMQRPGTMPEHDATPNTGSPNAMNDGPDERMANAPAPQMRADHDRPLRRPADPGARPPADADAPPKRIMPIVPVVSLGRIVRAYKSAVTRMAYRDGLLPHGTPVWQRNYWDRVPRSFIRGAMTTNTNALRGTSATTPPIGKGTGSTNYLQCLGGYRQMCVRR